MKTYEIEEMFKSEGLGAPYVPEELDEMLVKDAGELIYSTRELVADIYDIDYYINETVSTRMGNYLIVGFSGHGAASWNMYYYLKYHDLALFLQLKWGGIVNDVDYQKTRINGYFCGVPVLLSSLINARNEGRIRAGKKLMIVESDKVISGWTWYKDMQKEIKDPEWHLEGPVMLNALMALT